MLGGRVSSLTGVKGRWAGPLNCPACRVCMLDSHLVLGREHGATEGASLTLNVKG